MADAHPLDAPSGEPSSPQRLYLHVGLPKTGSSYLQAVLGNNRAALREHGYLYPYVRQEGMFHAAVEMAGSPQRWGLTPEDVSGTFAHLLRRGRRLGGTVLISHEIFGAATAEQVVAMREMLDDFDVHVVVTVRDLGRTVTADWQERVKNGTVESFAQFAESLVERIPADPGQSGSFWRSQNLATLLDRWQLVAPPEQIHVVTCPRSGSAPDLLWRRFSEAIGLPHDTVDLSEVPERNESLGSAQIALLARVLEALDGRMRQPWRSRLVKRWFAQTLLSRVSSAKPVTPREVAEQLTTVSDAWIGSIRAGRYQVHGDLEELWPEIADADAPHPDDVAEIDLYEGVPSVMAEMLLRAQELQVELGELREQGRATTRERDELAARVDELTAEVAGLRARRLRLPSLLTRVRERAGRRSVS